MAEQVIDALAFPQEETDRIFDELGELRVELDDDPISFGPKRLNMKTAQVRRMLDRCENLFLSVSRKLQANRRALRSAETELDLAKKYLFANDPETRAGRSVSDREAIASGKLDKEIRTVLDLNVVVDDLDAVLAVIKAKRSDLKDTEGRLRDQMRLCSEEIGLGGHWGSKVPNAPDLQGRPVREVLPSSDIMDIESVLQSVDGEINLSRGEGVWKDPDDAGPSPILPVEEEDDEVVVPSVIGPTFVRKPVLMKSVDPVPSTEQKVELDPVIPFSTDTEILDDSHVPDDMPDMDNDVTLILPSNVTSDSVSEFLDEVALNTSLSPKRVDHNKAVAELDVDSFLDAFEAI